MDSKISDAELIQALADGLSVSQISQQYNIGLRAVQRRKAKLRVSTCVDGSGNIKQQWVRQDYSSNKEDREEYLDSILEAFKAELPKYKPITRQSKIVKEDSLVVFPLGDPHVGMMAWHEECGEDWDLNIAEEVFIKIFSEVSDDVPACAHALIINLGDFFHYDNIEGMTSRSKNVLDKDGRAAKMFRVGILIARVMIEKALEKHKHVTWMNINGNHDDILSMALGEALRVCYENNPRISILCGYKPIQYFQWGKVLIAAHHGHTIKMEKLPSIIACDEPKIWGNTTFRYCHTGHIHCDSLKPLPGMQVESFSTLAGKDSYATWNGYRSTRNQKAIIYTRDGGEKKRYITNLP